MTPREVIFVGSSLDDLREFPAEVRQVIGRALREAQIGGKHQSAKPLKGYAGARVLEIVEPFAGDAFRAVYTVEFTEAVYVLHAFQKKSTMGKATPRRHMALIERRHKHLVADRLRRGLP